jgi:hypothetical protein
VFFPERKCFYTYTSAFVASAVASSVIANRCPFRTLLNFPKRSSRVAASPGDVTDAPKPSRCKVLFYRCVGALSCRRDQLFRAQHENVFTARKPAFFHRHTLL